MTARAGAASAADRRRTLAIVGRVLPAWARRRFGVLATLAIALVCGIGSANVLDAEFVAGDLQFIVENPAIRRPDVLVTAFTRGYWWVGGDADAGSYYRPLLVLTDALDFAVWGPRSLGFHLTSTLLYIVACALVFALARAVTRSPFAAIGAALVFAAHPIHAHATSYVSARSTVLCAAFYVGALVAALRFRRDAARGRARGRDLAVALGCYAGGLLTLEAAVTLPIALAVVLWPSRRVARAPLVRFAAAVVGVSAAYLVARRLALGGVLSHKQDLWELLSPIATALTMAKTVAWYLVKLFAPTDLSYVPPFLPVLDARDATGWASLALVVALAGFALAGPRRFGRERAAVGLALVTLAPVSGVLPLDHFVKGHYAFLPSIALAVVLALALRRAMRAAAASRGRGGAVAGLGVAVGAIVTAGVIGTLFANEAWQSPDALNARVRVAGGLELVLPAISWPEGAKSALLTIRPEKVHVSRQPVKASNTFEARVVEEVFKGAVDHLCLATAAGTKLDAIVANESALGEIFHSGDRVFCGLHADDLVVLRAD